MEPLGQCLGQRAVAEMVEACWEVLVGRLRVKGPRAKASGITTSRVAAIPCPGTAPAGLPDRAVRYGKPARFLEAAERQLVGLPVLPVDHAGREPGTVERHLRPHQQAVGRLGLAAAGGIGESQSVGTLRGSLRLFRLRPAGGQQHETRKAEGNETFQASPKVMVLLL
ncbi:hypothetical protein ACFSLT_09215 [Novosphingobium resinovorum]